MSKKRESLQLSRAETAVLLCVGTILLGSILPWSLTPVPLNSWNSSNFFMLGVGIILPIVFAVLFVSPAFSAWLGYKKADVATQKVANMRIGSLSVRQFGQVAAWLSLAYFVIHLLTTLSPILLIGTIGAVGLVLVTVLDRQIFGREIHPRTSRTREPLPAVDSADDVEDPVKPTLQRTTTGGIPVIAAVQAITEARERKHEDEQDPSSEETTQVIGEAPIISAQRSADFSQTRPQTAYSPQDAFWFAVHHARPVIDERSGAVLFTVEPGTWILALTERHDGFMVRSDAGIVGLMQDVSSIERA